MRKVNRSTGASLGAAFLFLGFAAVPVSLNAVGYEFSLGSRLCSVAAAWQQIAGVYGHGYQPINTAFWAAISDSETPDETTKPEDQPCEIASLGEAFEEAVCSDASPADSAPVPQSEATALKHSARALVARKRVDASLARKAVRPPITVQLQALEVEGAMKSLSPRQEELLRLIDERMDRYKMKLINASKFAPAPREVRVFVRAEPDEVTNCDLQKAGPAMREKDSAPRPRRVRMPIPAPRASWSSSSTE